MFLALIRPVLFEKRLHMNQSTTTSSAIMTQENLTFVPYVAYRNLSQNSFFSIDFGYDCRSVLRWL